MSKVYSKIFLDMDGVIVDFRSAQEQLIQDTIHEGVDTNKSYKAMSDKEKAASKFLWRESHKLGIDFWRDMDMYANTHQLIEACQLIANEVILLTSVPKSNKDVSIAGKKAWLTKHGINLEMIPVCGVSKRMYAEYNSLLIDDRLINCEEFAGREDGYSSALHVEEEGMLIATILVLGAKAAEKLLDKEKGNHGTHGLPYNILT